MFLNNWSLLKLLNKVPYFFFVILVLHIPPHDSHEVFSNYSSISSSNAFLNVGNFWGFLKLNELGFYILPKCVFTLLFIFLRKYSVRLLRFVSFPWSNFEPK